MKELQSHPTRTNLIKHDIIKKRPDSREHIYSKVYKVQKQVIITIVFKNM